MPTICDICGKHLTPAEVKTIPATPVVHATSNGYVPSKLPPTWKPQCEMLGVSIASHWANVVKINSSTDWGLCPECLTELNSFAAPSPVSGELFATALGYCMHFTLEGVAMPQDMSAALKTLALQRGLTNDQIGQIAADAVLKKDKNPDEMRAFIFQALEKAADEIKSTSSPAAARAKSVPNSAGPKKPWWYLFKR